MHDVTPIGFVALAAFAFPALAFALIGLSMLLRGGPAERTVTRIVSIAFTASVVSALSVAAYFVLHDDRPILIELGYWFQSDGEGFQVSLLIDRLSVPMMLLTAGICGVIGRFSATYLVLEPGQARFHLLLSMFATGMLLLVMAGSLDLLVAGWELVGLSSMLLIGFFHDRAFPVRNALRAFVIYRVCDTGLLIGTVLMHHYAHTAVFSEAFGLDSWPKGTLNFSTQSTSLIALSILWAACGKSALFPMGSWLPRAMEGPTPSSAIFYGALSVHAGAYLMLRMIPLLAHAPLASAVVVGVGLLTAIHGTLVARVQTDVKSQLAYATTTQVGVIFMEIGLGFPRLALVHLVSHAVLRTLQFLRAPNTMHDLLRLREGLDLPPHVARAAPSRLELYVYHLALERFHLDAFWERVVAHPIVRAAELIDHSEGRLVALLTRDAEPRRLKERRADSGKVTRQP